MKLFRLISIALVMIMAYATFSFADSAREIDSDASKALTKFYHEIPAGKKFLEKAKGYVIFPDVKEAGFFFGGKYGEGVLRVNGKSKSFHSITALSMGFHMGIQTYSLIIAFTSDEALKNFILDDDDWETDMDTKIVMAEWTADDDDVDEKDFGTDMIGFAFDSSGMMGKFAMEGVKFERITP